VGFMLKLPSLKLSLICAGTGEHEESANANGSNFL
jgi:hypothetical protein